MIVTAEIIDEFIKNENEKKRNALIPQKSKNVKYHLRKSIFQLLSNSNNQNINNEKIDPLTINKVLLLRYDALGDYIVSTPIIRILKELNPNMIIDVVTSPRNDFLVKKDPFINKTIKIEEGKKQLFSIYKLQSENDYDLAFDLIHTKATISALILRFLAKSAEKITVKHNTRSEIYSYVFNRQVAFGEVGDSWAEKLLYFVFDSFIINTDIQKKIDGLTNPYIYIPDDTFYSISLILKKYNLEYKPQIQNIICNKDSLKELEGKKYIIINIAGKGKTKTMTADTCLKFIQNCADNYPNSHIFITGGPAYVSLIDDIVEVYNQPYCSQLHTNIYDFIAITAGAELVITPDTGVVHIAGATGVPQIILYTEKYQLLNWFPHKSPFVSVLAEDGDINNITSDDIKLCFYEKFRIQN